VDFGPWILELPGFIVGLRDLLRRAPQLEADSDRLLGQVVARLRKYPELHYMLKDWKTFHHELHGIQLDLQNSVQFEPFLSPKDPPHYPPSVDLSKRSNEYEVHSIDPFLAMRTEFARIFPIVIPKKEFRSNREVAGDFHSDLENIESEIRKAIPRKDWRLLEDLFQDLDWLLTQGITTADTSIRQIAGSLADLSIALNERLTEAGLP
jgi:hypothetical protein